jgi:hypothetical protein
MMDVAAQCRKYTHHRTRQNRSDIGDFWSSMAGRDYLTQSSAINISGADHAGEARHYAEAGHSRLSPSSSPGVEHDASTGDNV